MGAGCVRTFQLARTTPSWNERLMAPKAVLFDIGDTLWHSAEAPPAAEFRRIAGLRCSEFLAGEGLSEFDPALVARTAWDALEEAMRTARATDRIEPDYAEVARIALEQLGVHLSRPRAGALMEAIYVSGVEGGKAAYPGSRETLEVLRRRGFRLAIVTNRAFGGQRFKDDLRAAGLDADWDATVISVEVGFLKPHQALFRAALSELALTPSEVVMVGNSLLEDVRGAQALGIPAAWKRSTPDAEGVQPDFVFDEVPQLLDWDLLKGNAE